MMIRFAELLFEKMCVPGLMMYKDAALTCFSRGRTSGLVCDIGEEFTRCCGVFDGFIDPQYVSYQRLAGSQLGDCYAKHYLYSSQQDILPRGCVPLFFSFSLLDGLISLGEILLLSLSRKGNQSESVGNA